ncbi:MAG: hypothetical protein DMG59_26815 [Acidobacteria bacterium]|jgi:chromosome segregation ATPase|nr:MAG: hypothetical protein DMG59_26815 [Acidobacteriota bacterium]
MDNNQHERHNDAPGGDRRIITVLVVGLVLALVGNVYLLVRATQLNHDIAQMRESTQAQITKIGDATTALLEQRLEALNEQMRGATDAANAVAKQARSETQRQSVQFSRKLEQQQQQVATEITQLKDATTTANSKLSEVSTDVNGVKTDVNSVKSDIASTQSTLDKTGAELKRVVGDMGVMSGLIATNSKDLVALRALGERNYFEFNLTKSQSTKKVGDVTLTLKKSDPKRNRYSVEVMADDKRVEKKDRTVNEPVQLYVAENRQPYEIVVNQVKKDEVIGYLSTPKVKISRR